MSEWISVEEKLPEDYEYVLVWYTYFRYGNYNKDYSDHAIAYYVEKYKMWFGKDPLGTNPRIKYWTPLPKPPKN